MIPHRAGSMVGESASAMTCHSAYTMIGDRLGTHRVARAGIDQATEKLPREGSWHAPA